MIPILHENTETAFQTNGIGRLSDATACTVSERLNDFYTLTLTYAADGLHAADLRTGRLILATPSDGTRPQPFRIYEVSKRLDGLIEVLANHISYDLSGYPMRNASGTTAAEAVATLSSRAIIAPPFDFSTDLSVTKDWQLVGPSSIRAQMGGSEESIQGVYGGEWLFDRYDCKLLASRGSDNGVSIRYGKNLTDLNAVSNEEEAFTGVLAYYLNGSDYASSNIQYLDSSAVPPRIQLVDHTSDYERKPSTADLDVDATADLAKIAGVTDSLTVSFAALWQFDEYKDLRQTDRVGLGDFVTVVYEDYGIRTKLEVVQTDYNVLLDRYDTIELGVIRPTLADTIANLSK